MRPVGSKNGSGDFSTPPVPARPDESITLLPLLNLTVQRLEARVKLLEDESRGGIDITKFYNKPATPDEQE